MSDFWSKRNPREKVMIVLGLLVVLIGGWMLLAPDGSSNKKLLQASLARQKGREAEQKKRAADAEAVRLKAELSRMVSTQAPDRLVPQTVRALQSMAKASGIHLREVKPLRARRMATVTKIPLTVRYTAEFAKSIPFLYRVEDPAGKLVVEKLNVNASGSKSRTVDVEAQVALFTQAEEARR